MMMMMVVTPEHGLLSTSFKPQNLGKMLNHATCLWCLTSCPLEGDPGVRA